MEGGYLFLAGTPEGCATLRENHALQTSLGADIVLLEKAALAQKFPWLHVGDVDLGCLGRTGEGWFDPWALLTGFRRKVGGWVGCVRCAAHVQQAMHARTHAHGEHP